MTFDTFLFFLFTSLSFISAFLVISLSNAVQSVLFLVFTFFNVACLLILLGAEFFSFLLIIVYVGAIAVLFLFVIMMLNIKFSTKFVSIFSILPISAFILFLFLNNFKFLCLDLVRLGDSKITWISWFLEGVSLTNVTVIGQNLYTNFSLLFFLSGFILLVAMIGAIVLTMHQISNSKKQKINFQLIRNPKTSIKFMEFRK
uniref:NADH dehydrogenase subunit 6 n=1 Tax=Antithamnionella miharai TaxID=536589 RepID=UPI002E772639|nr:NADH dehydrogenase subunit 6 [Antithamnionella miharai]WQF69355.1 NADH dehydrogenase subunit 6 [Antithamnionella miharai]WQF69380.1 NADH dehydrogenase subunit 6 [Antithamnionella miharai]